MSHEDEVIFKLDREDYQYKGILFAELDRTDTYKEMEGCFPPLPEDYSIQVVALIWTDETGMWHSKIRVKFPSGKKQLFYHKFDKEMNLGIQVNETFVLHKIYKIPLIKKIWRRNPEGTADGILKIIKKLNKMESYREESIEK